MAGLRLKRTFGTRMNTDKNGQTRIKPKHFGFRAFRLPPQRIVHKALFCLIRVHPL
jgi:hypothetical protein